MIHCLPYIILFITQKSYGFISNPQDFSCKDKFFKKSSATCMVSYKTLSSLIYITNVEFLCSTNSSYICLFMLTMIFVIRLSIFNCIVENRFAPLIVLLLEETENMIMNKSNMYHKNNYY